MLTITIGVNDDIIFGIGVLNTGLENDKGEMKYRVMPIAMNSESLKQTPAAFKSMPVYHRRQDGALELSIKALHAIIEAYGRVA